MHYFEDIQIAAVSHVVTSRSSLPCVIRYGGLGVMRGATIFARPGNEILLNSPFLYLLRPGECCSWKTPGGAERENFWIAAAGARFERITDSLFRLMPESGILPIKNPLPLIHEFNRMREVFSAGTEESAAYTVVVLEELVLNIYRLCGKTHQSDPVQEKILLFASRMKESPGIPWNLRELAGKCGVSPQYFRVLFRKYTGATPYEFILDRRLALAKSLLSGSCLSMKEIAFECGFASQSDFSRFFRKRMNMTPGMFSGMQIY